MPLDVRKLIFTRQELRLAFQKYAKDNNMNVPDSHVEDLEIHDDKFNSAVSDTTSGGITITLRYTSSDPHNPIRLRLSQHQAQEALVTLCRSLHIPVPKRGQKFLQIHKDSLALTIGMSQDDIRDSSSSSTFGASKAEPVTPEPATPEPEPASPDIPSLDEVEEKPANAGPKLVRPDHAVP